MTAPARDGVTSDGVTGDSVSRTEWLAPQQARALAGLLGVPAPAEDAALPPTWHWIYLLERPEQSALGPDGHPVTGIPAPPEEGRRRMWAGGSIRALRPLLLSREATRTTRVLGSTEKVGRSGRLTLLTVGHEISQDGQLCVAERQDIVYRDAVSGGEAPVAPAEPAAPAEPSGEVEPSGGELSWQVTPPFLFRYSALTYNAHRIHYDRDYARDVEGYPGLVVHGPLQTCAMTEAARAAGLVPQGPFTVDYRLVSPLFDFQGLVAGAERVGPEVTTWVRDAFGRPTATGVIRTET